LPHLGGVKGQEGKNLKGDNGLGALSTPKDELIHRQKYPKNQQLVKATSGEL
jgi:hypothetical protein